MPRLRLFLVLMLRPLRQEPLRTGLTVLAVALGVAVVLAIDLAGEAAAGSFRSSVETLTGDADLEVTAVGGVPDAVVATLATMPYALRIKVRIEDYAALSDSGEVVPFIGVDMVADAIENLDGTDPIDASNRDEIVWLSKGFSKKTGETIRLQVNDRTAEFTVGGTFDTPGKVVAADIYLAQQLLGRAGKLDRILIWVPRQPDIETWQKRLESALPGGVTVRPQGARTRENRRMLDAFRWNLRVLSYIALIVGAFLIYNTIAVSVVRRRADIGILRALGATREMILAAFLLEAAAFGVAGAVAGLFLGRAMAVGAVRMLGATVEALYVSSKPAAIELTWGSTVLAFVIGVGVAVVSALSPAREASGVAPVEAMARGRSDYHSRVSKRRNLILAALVAALAAASSHLDAIGGKPIGGYVAALLLIGAAALAIPSMIAAINALTSRMLLRAFGVEAMLASRSLAASLHRTSVLVGALATAIAMMVSVGIMVGSFRQTVLIWMDNQLKADLYLRPAGNASADRFPTLAVDIPDKISALPSVRAVDRFRAYPISFRGLPATLAGGEISIPGNERNTHFLSGNAADIRTRMPLGDYVIISEPFANKHKLRTGDRIPLAVGGLDREFEILGVYYDYANERGYVIMDRSTLLKYLPDPAPSNLAVWLKPDADLDAARAAIDRVTAGRSVAVFSNRSLRSEAIKIFDRTFAITYALEFVAVVVAVMGVAGALLALVIDRKRELGLLRFLGAAQSQVRRLILFEAGILGLLANLAGFALGVALSLVLVFVINKQSFGWTIQFHWPVAVLVGALSIVYAATVLAGLYPARIATRMNPIDVVHEE